MPALIGFGLALGLNPALYGATADTLARGVNVVPRLGWLLAGLGVGATILLFALHSFNPDGLVSVVKHDMDAAVFNRTVDLAVGVLCFLIAAGVGFWKIRSPELAPATGKKATSRANPASFFVLGLSSSVIGFTTLPIMYLTGRLVTGLSHDLLPRALAYCVFLVALGGPFVLLAWAWSRFPTATGKVTEAYTRALKWDYRWLTAGFVAGLGVICFGLALFGHS